MVLWPGLTKRIFRFIIKRVCGRFLEEVSADQLEVKLLSGSVQLTNVRLKVHVLNTILSDHLPGILIAGGVAGKITITVPWTSLMSGAQCTVLIEDVSLLLEVQPNAPQDDFVSALGGSRSVGAKSVLTQSKLMTRSLLVGDVDDAEMAGLLDGSGSEDDIDFEGTGTEESLDAIGAMIEQLVSQIKVEFLNLRIQLEQFYLVKSAAAPDAEIDSSRMEFSRVVYHLHVPRIEYYDEEAKVDCSSAVDSVTGKLKQADIGEHPSKPSDAQRKHNKRRQKVFLLPEWYFYVYADSLFDAPDVEGGQSGEIQLEIPPSGSLFAQCVPDVRDEDVCVGMTSIVLKYAQGNPRTEHQPPDAQLFEDTHLEICIGKLSLLATPFSYGWLMTLMSEVSSVVQTSSPSEGYRDSISHANMDTFMGSVGVHESLYVSNVQPTRTESKTVLRLLSVNITAVPMRLSTSMVDDFWARGASADAFGGIDRVIKLRLQDAVVSSPAGDGTGPERVCIRAEYVRVERGSSRIVNCTNVQVTLNEKRQRRMGYDAACVCISCDSIKLDVCDGDVEVLSRTMSEFSQKYEQIGDTYEVVYVRANENNPFEEELQSIASEEDGLSAAADSHDQTPESGGHYTPSISDNEVFSDDPLSPAREAPVDTPKGWEVKFNAKKAVGRIGTSGHDASFAVDVGALACTLVLSPPSHEDGEDTLQMSFGTLVVSTDADAGAGRTESLRISSGEHKHPASPIWMDVDPLERSRIGVTWTRRSLSGHAGPMRETETAVSFALSTVAIDLQSVDELKTKRELIRQIVETFSAVSGGESSQATSSGGNRRKSRSGDEARSAIPEGAESPGDTVASALSVSGSVQMLSVQFRSGEMDSVIRAFDAAIRLTGMGSEDAATSIACTYVDSFRKHTDASEWTCVAFPLPSVSPTARSQSLNADSATEEKVVCLHFSSPAPHESSLLPASASTLRLQALFMLAGIGDGRDPVSDLSVLDLWDVWERSAPTSGEPTCTDDVPASKASGGDATASRFSVEVADIFVLLDIPPTTTNDVTLATGFVLKRGRWSSFTHSCPALMALQPEQLLASWDVNGDAFALLERCGLDHTHDKVSLVKALRFLCAVDTAQLDGGEPHETTFASTITPGRLWELASMAKSDGGVLQRICKSHGIQWGSGAERSSGDVGIDTIHTLCEHDAFEEFVRVCVVPKSSWELTSRSCEMVALRIPHALCPGAATASSQLLAALYASSDTRVLSTVLRSQGFRVVGGVLDVNIQSANLGGPRCGHDLTFMGATVGEVILHMCPDTAAILAEGFGRMSHAGGTESPAEKTVSSSDLRSPQSGSDSDELRTQIQAALSARPGESPEEVAVSPEAMSLTSPELSSPADASGDDSPSRLAGGLEWSLYPEDAIAITEAVDAADDSACGSTGAPSLKSDSSVSDDDELFYSVEMTDFQVNSVSSSSSSRTDSPLPSNEADDATDRAEGDDNTGTEESPSPEPWTGKEGIRIIEDYYRAPAAAAPGSTVIQTKRDFRARPATLVIPSVRTEDLHAEVLKPIADSRKALIQLSRVEIGTIRVVAYSGNDWASDEDPSVSARNHQSRLELLLYRTVAELCGHDDLSRDEQQRPLGQSVLAVVDSFQLLDRIRESNRNKIVCLWSSYENIHLYKGMPMLRISVTSVVSTAKVAREGRTLATSPSLDTSVEHRVSLSCLPLRVNVDQRAIDLGMGFLESFTQSQQSLTPGLMSPVVNADPDDLGRRFQSRQSEVYIQHLEIASIPLTISYHPRAVNLKSLHNGQYVELMNFFPLDNVRIVLPSIDVGGKQGWAAAGTAVMDVWIPSLKKTQLHKCLSGIKGISSIMSIGEGVTDLVMLPYEEYKRSKKWNSVGRGLKRGMERFLKRVGVEAASLTANVATGTQNILEAASDLVGEDRRGSQSGARRDGRHPISKRANQPGTATEGVSEAFASISRGVAQSYRGVVCVPFEELRREGSGGKEVVRRVIRAVPVAILNPMIAASEATAKLAWGIRNQLDPSGAQDLEDIYKQSK